MAERKTSAYISVMEGVDDTDWMERARCRFPGAHEFWCCNSAKTNESKKRRAWAVIECSMCEVQWRCCEYAIDTMDYWNICAVTPEDREYLEHRNDWRGLLAMAADCNMPVVELVRNVRCATT